MKWLRALQSMALPRGKSKVIPPSINPDSIDLVYSNESFHFPWLIKIVN